MALIERISAFTITIMIITAITAPKAGVRHGFLVEPSLSTLFGLWMIMMMIIVYLTLSQ